MNLVILASLMVTTRELRRSGKREKPSGITFVWQIFKQVTVSHFKLVTAQLKYSICSEFSPLAEGGEPLRVASSPVSAWQEHGRLILVTKIKLEKSA